MAKENQQGRYFSIVKQQKFIWVLLCLGACFVSEFGISKNIFDSNHIAPCVIDPILLRLPERLHSHTVASNSGRQHFYYRDITFVRNYCLLPRTETNFTPTIAFEYSCWQYFFPAPYFVNLSILNRRRKSTSKPAKICNVERTRATEWKPVDFQWILANQ